MNKMLRKGTLLSVIIAIVIAAGVVVAALFGFNGNTALKDTKTLTVTMNSFVYSNMLDEVQADCEDAFDGLKVLQETKGEMSGDDCEIVYVFDKDADIETVADDLQKTFDAKTAAGAEWDGSFISVSAAYEEVTASVAKGYALRAVIAVVVIAVLAFAYVAIRYSVGMGILAGVCSLVGAALAFAIAMLTRLPVTAATAYVIVSTSLLVLVSVVLTLNKLRATVSEEQTTDEWVSSSVATKEISTLSVLLAAAFVIIAIASLIAGGLTAITWFAIVAVIAVAVSAFVGLVYAPALYVPIRESVDKNWKKSVSNYIGAKRTSLKTKKIFAKKEEPAEEVEEEATEEVVEEPVEEVVEEATEEVVEEATEEVVEEPTEEAEEKKD